MERRVERVPGRLCSPAENTRKGSTAGWSVLESGVGSGVTAGFDFTLVCTALANKAAPGSSSFRSICRLTLGVQRREGHPVLCRLEAASFIEDAETNSVLVHMIVTNHQKRRQLAESTARQATTFMSKCDRYMSLKLNVLQTIWTTEIVVQNNSNGRLQSMKFE